MASISYDAQQVQEVGWHTIVAIRPTKGTRGKGPTPHQPGLNAANALPHVPSGLLSPLGHQALKMWRVLLLASKR